MSTNLAPMLAAGDAVRAILSEIIASDPRMARCFRSCGGEERANGIAIAEVETSDWGTKTERGRECRSRVQLTFDPGERDAMAAMADAIETACEALSGPVLVQGRATGWRLANVRLVRSLTVRLSDGRARTMVDHRFHLLAEAG